MTTTLQKRIESFDIVYAKNTFTFQLSRGGLQPLGSLFNLDRFNFNALSVM